MSCDSAIGGVLCHSRSALRLWRVRLIGGGWHWRSALRLWQHSPRHVCAATLGHRRRRSEMVFAPTVVVAGRWHSRSALRLCHARYSTDCCDWRRARRSWQISTRHEGCRGAENIGGGCAGWSPRLPSLAQSGGIGAARCAFVTRVIRRIVAIGAARGANGDGPRWQFAGDTRVACALRI